jgi:PKD repeat protein
VAITPDQAPIASFTVTTGTAGSASAFDASASTVAYGTITSYAWNFGDGNGATTSTPTTTHVYAAAGSYTATVTETDSAGTSTTQVFNGQTMSRNGGSAAQTSRLLTVEAAPPLTMSPLPTLMTPGPGAPPSFGPSPAPTPVVISPKSVVATSSGDVLVGVRCPVTALGGCRGRITLLLSEPRAPRARAHAARCARGCRSLGSSNYQARAGQTKRIRVHMASFGRKLLARRRAVRVSVLATDTSGSKTATTALTITLKAHRGHS